MKTAWPRVVLAAAACAGVAASGSHLPDQPAQVRDAAFVPDPETARLAALGFDAAVADLYWMRAVQIVGSQQGAAGRNGLIGALIDVVTSLDPWVDHPYRFAAVWMKDDEAAVRKANELLRRGIAHHPADWRNYFYLAFNHFFFLDEQVEAAAALKPALELPEAPLYLSRLYARLESNQGGLDAAAAFLAELVKNAPAQERASYEQALLEIETERRARFLDAARAEHVRRHHRDISRVEDLVAGGVLSTLPPDPFGLGWTLSEQTGQIVSAFTRYRYGIKIDATNREQLAQFRERSREARGQ